MRPPRSLLTDPLFWVIALPVLIRTGAKAAQQRGLNKSTVQEILRLSQALADDIETHLDVEETVIFPYILNLKPCNPATL